MVSSVKQGRILPRLFLPEETATLEQLRSYLQGFLTLKGKPSGKFECGSTTTVDITTRGLEGCEEYIVSVEIGGTQFRVFSIQHDRVRLKFHIEPLPRNTTAFHAWFITAHLSGHLVQCFQKKRAA